MPPAAIPYSLASLPFPPGWNAPAIGGVAITPHDTNEQPCKAIYVGVSGTLVVETWDGTSLTFANVPVGIFPVACRLIKAATTAASLVGLT